MHTIVSVMATFPYFLFFEELLESNVESLRSHPTQYNFYSHGHRLTLPELCFS